MGRGIFKGLLSGLEVAGQAVDARKSSNAAWYGIGYGLMGAFAVFYFFCTYLFLTFRKR